MGILLYALIKLRVKFYYLKARIHLKLHSVPQGQHNVTKVRVFNVEICTEHLKSNLTLQNALDVLIVAYQTNQNSLLDTAFQFAFNHKGQLNAEKWNEMTRNHPALIAKAMGQVMGIS